MIKNILKSIAVVLALILMTLSFLYLNRRDPYRIIPGKQITGEEVPGSIEDWSFTLESTSSLLVEDVLYIPSGGGEHSRWAQFLVEDPNMRLKVGTKIYKVRATRVEEPSHLDRVREAYGKKYPRTPPENLAKFWFFQIDSR